MPVVHVRALEPAQMQVVDDTLVEIAAGVADVLDEDPGHTWCTFTALDHQTIGEHAAAGPGQIVYADVTIRDRGADTHDAVLRAVAGELSRGFGVPIEDVWITLNALGPGDAFAGGDVID